LRNLYESINRLTMMVHLKHFHVQLQYFQQFDSPFSFRWLKTLEEKEKMRKGRIGRKEEEPGEESEREKEKSVYTGGMRASSYKSVLS